VVVGRTAAAWCPTSGTSQGSGDVACFYSGGEIRCLTRQPLQLHPCIAQSLHWTSPRAGRLPLPTGEINLEQILLGEGTVREENLPNQSVGRTSGNTPIMDGEPRQPCAVRRCPRKQKVLPIVEEA